MEDADRNLDEPADPRLIDHLARTSALPPCYLSFLAAHNGGEVQHRGESIIFWRAEELEEFNCGYNVEEFAPGVFLAGTSGGGDAYGFDLSDADRPFIRLPFIPMDREFLERVDGDFAAIVGMSA